jgi:protein SCO1/2/putative membrane protein
MMSTSRFYRRGLLIVLWVVLASALLAAATLRYSSPPAQAAQDLGDLGQRLGPFQLLERSGRIITELDLADRVCIVSFIFTRCQLSCPRITSVMKSLEGRPEGSSVLLVSISVDPDHDTPQVLTEYARGYGADPERWWFLTGPRPVIYDLIGRRFLLSVMENPAADPDGKGEAIAHSDRLALVDRGQVVGLFDSGDPRALDALVASARRRATPAWVRGLPPVNASLNALCAVLLVLGWSFIRGSTTPQFEDLPGGPAGPAKPLLAQFRVKAHIACMVLAVLTSAAFLGCYLVYHYHAGSRPFRGEGPARLLYFTVLLSHTVLATFGVVPLVCLTLLWAVRRDFQRHRSIASTLIPIWLYVSVTGVVVYLMLYHLPTPTLFRLATS